jgi:hypothetical protein
MQVQINTDHNIEGHEALAARVREIVESALSRISDNITRVEIHLPKAYHAPSFRILPQEDLFSRKRKGSG